MTFLNEIIINIHLMFSTITILIESTNESNVFLIDLFELLIINNKSLN